MSSYEVQSFVLETLGTTQTDMTLSLPEMMLASGFHGIFSCLGNAFLFWRGEVLGIEPRSSHMLSTHSTTELHLSPALLFWMTNLDSVSCPQVFPL